MGDHIKLDLGLLDTHISTSDLESMCARAVEADKALTEGTGSGSESLGWVDLPEKMLLDGCDEVDETVSALRDLADTLIVIGIGGSYLGARSAVGMLAPGKIADEIVFTGYGLSARPVERLLRSLGDRDVAVNVISKSGTTMETAVCFRVLEDHLKDRYSREELARRIVCTTDPSRGALKKIAEERSYRTLEIPGNVGGRFSVLSAVGLLPMAWCGIDARDVLQGAVSQKEVRTNDGYDHSPSVMYAASRNALYRKGKAIEVMSCFDSDLHYLLRWWQQLFGESEGKDGKGIFPACCDFTTDLHSMGQWIQQGERSIFETFLSIPGEPSGVLLPSREQDHDGLNYLAGKDLEFINRRAYEATRVAHYEGGVPNMTIEMPGRDAFALGALLYFFERAAGISGYLLGVNPFDQPGVESYKRKMLELLGKGRADGDTA